MAFSISFMCFTIYCIFYSESHLIHKLASETNPYFQIFRSHSRSTEEQVTLLSKSLQYSYSQFLIPKFRTLTRLNQTRQSFEKISNEVRKYTRLIIHLHLLDSYYMYFRTSTEAIKSLSMSTLPSVLKKRASKFKGFKTGLQVNPSYVIFLIQDLPIKTSSEIFHESIPTFRMRMYAHLKEVLFNDAKYFLLKTSESQLGTIIPLCLHCNYSINDIHESTIKIQKYATNVERILTESWKRQNYDLKGHKVTLFDNGINFPDPSLKYSCSHRMIFGLNGSADKEIIRITIDKVESANKKVAFPDTCVLIFLAKRLNMTLIPVVKYRDLLHRPEESNLLQEVITHELRIMWNQITNIKHLFVSPGRPIYTSYCERRAEYRLKIFVHKNATSLDLMSYAHKPFDAMTWSLLLSYMIIISTMVHLLTRVIKRWNIPQSECLTFVDMFLWVLGALCVQYNPRTVRNLRQAGVGCMFMGWTVAAMILGNGYSSILYRYFTAKPPPSLPSDINELLESTIPVIAVKPISEGNTWLIHNTIRKGRSSSDTPVKIKELYDKIYKRVLEVPVSNLDYGQLMYNLTSAIPIYAMTADNHFKARSKAWYRNSPSSLKAIPPIYSILDLEYDVKIFRDLSRVLKEYLEFDDNHYYKQPQELPQTGVIFTAQNKFLGSYILDFLKWTDNTGIFVHWHHQNVQNIHTLAVQQWKSRDSSRGSLGTKSMKSDRKPLKLQEVIGVFKIILGGVAISLIVFCGQHIYTLFECVSSKYF